MNALFLPAKQRICPNAHPDLCLATIPPGGQSGGWDRSIWEERTPFRALEAGLTADEFLLLREDVDERFYRDEVGAGGAWRDGSTADGVPRWRCRCCGRRSTSLTGTVLEHRRKPLPVWVSFIRLIRHNVPVECAAEPCGITHKTAFEWRHRVLAKISGYLDWYVYLFRVNQARRMGSDCKGGAPYPDSRRDRRDLPQLEVGASSPVI